MRLRPWITLTLLVVLVSCGKSIKYDSLSDKRPEFRVVYELKDTSPDSAFSVINRIADTLNEEVLRRSSEFLFAEYQVLKADVGFKSRSNVVNYSSIAAACEFYESLLSTQRTMNCNKDLAFQYAHACYYKAVAEERNDELYAQAFSDYLKSLWIVDGLNNERHVFSLKKKNPDYEHFTGLVYDRLARFFYNYDILDHALECLESSNACFLEENFLEGFASNNELIGDIMLAQEKLDAAVVYYHRCDSINELLQKDSDFLKFNDLFHRGIALSSAGDYDGAKALFLQGLQHPNQEWMDHRLHLGLAVIYNDLQMYDSALFHFERAYPLSPRQDVKSFCWIVNLANQQGDSVKAARYGSLLADIYLEQMSHSGQRTRLVSLFENYKSDSKDVRNRDLFYFVLFVIVVLALVIVVDTVFIHKRKRRHKREIEQHERIKASLENEIETTRRSARRKEEEVKALEVKLKNVVSNPDFQNLPFEKKMETLNEMPICKRVCMVKTANVKAGLAYPELVLSENQMTHLVNAVDAVFPKFSFKLMEHYPRMKRSDIVYCCMYVLGVTEVQAAALTGKTYQAVWTRSAKLHEIFGNKSDLQLFLHDFLKNW